MVSKSRSTQNSFEEKVSPANLLLYSSVVVALPGLLLIIVGLSLGISRGEASGHYSLVYVGLALFLASVITISVAIKRIIQTNRYLKQLGLSASEFIAQWNTQDLNPLRPRSLESRLTDVEALEEHEVQYSDSARLPMPPRRAVL